MTDLILSWEYEGGKISSTSAIEFLNYLGVRNVVFQSFRFDPKHSWLIRKKMSFQVAFIRE